MTTHPLKVIQTLPTLNSGGVERGTLEFARKLVESGHQSIVISSGGQLVERLEQEGTQHITMPVHKKSLSSLFQVKPMRQILQSLKPDIVHVRSRVPAWIAWLAWRKLPPSSRPKLVSTFHGMYSVNRYSAIMAKADHLIAISDCVHDYILNNYAVDPNRITRIYRGLDSGTFNDHACTDNWKKTLYQEHPHLAGKHLILMPGRLSRWKGQEAFLHMMKHLLPNEPNCHGIIVGTAEANKEHYQEELIQLCNQLNLTHNVSFMGHRTDIEAFYDLASITCHMSNKAEPFGRTVPEALACGCPVVAYDRGGASESLKTTFPQGLVEPDNIIQFSEKVTQLIHQQHSFTLPDMFFLDHQAQATINIYQKLISD